MVCLIIGVSQHIDCYMATLPMYPCMMITDPSTLQLYLAANYWHIASETKIKQRSVSRLILHWSWSSVHVQVLIFSLWNSDIEGYGQQHPPPSLVFLSGLRCCYKSRCVFWPHICKVYKLFYVITNSLSHNKTNWDNGLKNEFNLEITPGRCPVLGTTKISNKEILIRRVWGWTVTWQSGHMC